MTRDGGSSWSVCKGKFALSSYRRAVDDEGPTQRNGLLAGEGSESATRRRDGGTSTSEEKTGLGAKLSHPRPALANSRITSSSPRLFVPFPSTLLSARLAPLSRIIRSPPSFLRQHQGPPAAVSAAASVAARRALGLRAPTRPGLGDAGDGHMTVPTARSPSSSQHFPKLCLAPHGPAELVAQPSSFPHVLSRTRQSASRGVGPLTQRPASTPFPPARHDPASRYDISSVLSPVLATVFPCRGTGTPSNLQGALGVHNVGCASSHTFSESGHTGPPSVSGKRPIASGEDAVAAIFMEQPPPGVCAVCGRRV